ncbi:uncharacterized protein LY79DRAFT_558443 [Colletotrichum navitas]|uniref:Uncharacterized protein n=1 Tax=Colletotrichum navitas TaxID=681940 RepID=A0AAD8PWM2_9PEZI|nr:uncharacterized protein LY79DRAFT_558443 [Colletotrichum navitas]KAK1585598.1 hypothetical protein LY79DRAFT_558443 [Colletotrichum navitas]
MRKCRDRVEMRLALLCFALLGLAWLTGADRESKCRFPPPPHCFRSFAGCLG